MRTVLVALAAVLLIAVPVVAQENEPADLVEGQVVYQYGSSTIYCSIPNSETLGQDVVDCLPPSEVSLLPLPAPDPNESALSLEDWEVHKADADLAFQAAVDAKANTPKQERQWANGLVKWFNKEKAWLKKTTPHPCYVDNWDVWSAAVNEIGAGAKGMQRGLRTNNGRFVQNGAERFSDGSRDLILVDLNTSNSCLDEEV